MSPLSYLGELGFPQFRQVTNRYSVAEMFKPGHRSGIYVLKFDDQSYYVGISIDVVKRFSQHRMRFDDIAAMTFIEHPEADQRNLEEKVIHRLEASGVSLRNREHASLPQGVSDLDMVITPKQQQYWLHNPDFIDLEGVRPVDNSMYLRYKDDYKRFNALPNKDMYLRFLKEYLNAAIPAWKKTEMSFWSLTCLPKSPYKLTYQQPACARMNLSRQEVLTIGRNLRFNGRVMEEFCIFFVAESPLQNACGGSEEFASQYPFLGTWDHRYRDGGHDQACLVVNGVDNAKALLNNHDFRKALRLFNLRLMQKNPCLWQQNHCLALVEAAESN